jgi:hypothetical protein
MSVTRIYVVTRAGSLDTRLVEAVSQAQALRFVAEDEFVIKVANTKDVATAMAHGVELETVDPEPEEVDPPSEG